MRKKLIVAAIDFSPAAAAAMRRAAYVAAHAGARLALLHVAPPRPGGARIARAMPPESLLREAARLRSQYRVPVEAHIANGVAAREIGAFAGAARAELVVLGLRSAFLRNLLGGNTAQRLSRRAALPVLAVKRPARGPYRRILVPTDLSSASQRTAAIAARTFPRAVLHLLHAYRPPLEGPLAVAGIDKRERDGYRRHAVRKARLQLSEFASRLRHARTRLHVAVGHPAACIRTHARRIDADLIVLARTGKPWLETLLLGSVTRAVAPFARCDVLVVPQRT
jgi:nucleotide-binding universal stress UspA family protein